MALLRGGGGGIGSMGSWRPHFAEYDGKLYFNASDGAQRIWVYDGSAVSKLGNTIGNPAHFTVMNGKLYFYGIGDGFGGELWEYDGTNINNISDIRAGSENAFIVNPSRISTQFPVLNGSLYFEADDGVNGDELYKYDGNTVTRIDLNPTANSLGNGNPDFAVVINSKLYFQGYDGVTVTTLMEYDGANLKVIDLGEGAKSPRHMTELNGKVFFTTVVNDDNFNWQIFEYDGTSASLVITHGKTNSGEPYYITELGDNLYFTADDGIHGRELWSSNGNTTQLVADQYPGPDGTEGFNLTKLGDMLFYIGYTDQDDKAYTYDGTTFETFDISGSEGEYIHFNNAVYFQGYTSEFGSELYKYDGSTISLVQDIRSGSSGSSPQNFGIYNGVLYFSANDGTAGFELWKHDGEATTLVADINPGASHSSPAYFTQVGDKLYFRATVDGQGQELAMYDGTTVTMMEIHEGTTGSSPYELIEFNGKLIFRANDGISGHEFYEADGTNLRTIDINPTGNSYPSNFFEYKGKLYFEAYSDATGNELHVYDGTTIAVMELMPGIVNSYPSAFFEFGPYMYFAAASDGNPYGMHRYDGSGNVEFVAEIEPYVYSGDDYYQLAILENYAYFTAYKDSDSELWRMRKIEIENDIVSFSFPEISANASIDVQNHTVAIQVPFQTNVSALTPDISVSPYAMIDISGVQDFSNPFTYTVTSEYGEAQEWIVTVTVAENSAPTVISSIQNQSAVTGFGTLTVSTTGIFEDAEGHSLTLSVETDNPAVATGTTHANNEIQLTEVGPGSTLVTVTASDGFGGSVSTSFTLTVTDAPLSIDDKPAVRFYPNPTSDVLHIRSKKAVSARILDLNGKEVVSSSTASEMEIDLSGMKAGVYMLELTEDVHRTNYRIVKTN